MPPPWAIFKKTTGPMMQQLQYRKLQATDNQREFMMTVRGPQRYFIISWNRWAKRKILKSSHSSPPVYNSWRLRVKRRKMQSKKIKKKILKVWKTEGLINSPSKEREREGGRGGLGGKVARKLLSDTQCIACIDQSVSYLEKYPYT